MKKEEAGPESQRASQRYPRARRRIITERNQRKAKDKGHAKLVTQTRRGGTEHAKRRNLIQPFGEKTRKSTTGKG